MKYGDTRISKASPISCLRHFLNQDSPTCNKKYIHLDKEGEIFNNLDFMNLLRPFVYTVHLTVDDNFHQNEPVKQYHRILANSIRAILTVSNLGITILSNFPIHFHNLMKLLLLFRKIHQSKRTSPPFGPLYVVSMCDPLEI